MMPRRFAMGSGGENKIEVMFDDVGMMRLRACAAWRNVSVEELVRAYVEDWIDVDYPESQGRLTRRGIYRDGPIALDPQAKQRTSRNWVRDLGEEGL
jgi:hypothetical protein